MSQLLRPAPRARPSEPRDRLLAAATSVFYAEGIRHVGIEHLIATAGVTKATFYRHFPSKEDLVLAYLVAVHEAIRAGVAEVQADTQDPVAILRGLTAGITSEINGPHFRGCAFINAAAEYPHVDSRIHQAVLEHRAWFSELIEGLFLDAGSSTSARSARHYVMLRDGAMVAGYVADRRQAGETFTGGVEGLLRTTIPGVDPLRQEP